MLQSLMWIIQKAEDMSCQGGICMACKHGQDRVQHRVQTTIAQHNEWGWDVVQDMKWPELDMKPKSKHWTVMCKPKQTLNARNMMPPWCFFRSMTAFAERLKSNLSQNDILEIDVKDLRKTQTRTSIFSTSSQIQLYIYKYIVLPLKALDGSQNAVALY